MKGLSKFLLRLLFHRDYSNTSLLRRKKLFNSFLNFLVLLRLFKNNDYKNIILYDYNHTTFLY